MTFQDKQDTPSGAFSLLSKGFEVIKMTTLKMA